MKTCIIPTVLMLITSASALAAADDMPSLETAAPVVVRTVPAAGATDVDPGLTEIRVTYSKRMQDGSWSWSTWGEDTFPQLAGKPHYLEDGRTCVLPVKLEAGKFYATWLNSDKFKGFTDSQGRPAVPYLLTFKTGQAGGAKNAGTFEPFETRPVAEAPALEDIKNPVVLHYDNGVEADIESINGSGHAVRFSRAEGPAKDAKYVEAVQIFASRYGSPEPSEENFHLYILNEKDEVLADVPFPYSMIARANRKWYTLRTPSIEVPEKFSVALSFNPHRTKGIYMAYSKAEGQASHSVIGLPAEGFEKWKPVEWMIRVTLASEASKAKGFKPLADWKPAVKEDALAGSCWALFGGDQSQGIQSYGGSGPALHFSPVELVQNKPANGKYLLKGVRIYASRYGSGYSPEETQLKVQVLNGMLEKIADASFAYAKFTYRPGWVDLVLEKPILIEQPADPLTIAFDPGATQTKGIYFHYEKNPPLSHSQSGTVAKGFRNIPDREWMMRVAFE